MKKMFKYLKPVWLEVTFLIIFLVAQVVLQLKLPDEMSNISSLIAGVPANGTGEIWQMGFRMLAYSFGVVVSSIVIAYLSARVATQIGKLIRIDVYKKVSSFSMAEINRFGTSSLMTRTSNDILQVQQVFLMGLRIMITSPITIAIALTFALNKDWRLMLVLLASIPLIFIIIIILGLKVMPLFKVMQKKIDKTTLVLRENLTGARVIRAFNQEERETKRFDETNLELTNTYIKSNRLMSALMPSITVIMNLTYISVFFVGFIGFENQEGTAIMVQISEIMAIAQFVIQIMMALVMFAVIFVFIPRGAVSAARINEVLDCQSIINDPKESKVHESNIAGALEFKNVSFKFPDSDEKALDNISFVAKRGDTTAIIGSTGSGKSTIVNLIPRFFDPTEGQILLQGIDIKEISQHELHDKIGFVPQKAMLFSGTIKENLLFANESATDEDIKVATEIAQAQHFISKKEHGLETKVSQGGKNFSGGQKQRLAIARALVSHRDLYVFDDSFSALDFKTDIKVRQALKKHTKNSIVIIVAQRISSIMDADNIIVLDEGKLVASGKHTQLLKTCSVYQEIVNSQLDPDEVVNTLNLVNDIKGGE